MCVDITKRKEDNVFGLKGIEAAQCRKFQNLIHDCYVN